MVYLARHSGDVDDAAIDQKLDQQLAEADEDIMDWVFL